MNNGISETQKSSALDAAKLAVRRYARDPSETNAEQVSRAWRRIRDLNRDPTSGARMASWSSTERGTRQAGDGQTV